MPNYTLKPAQQIASNMMQSKDACAIWLDMGGGKTLAVIDALTKIKPNGNILIVAPKNIAMLTWEAEFEKWNFPAPVKSMILTTNKKTGKPRQAKATERNQIYREFADPNIPPKVGIINIDLFPALVDFYAKHNLIWPFQTIIVDESQMLKNPESKRFTYFCKVRPYVKRIYLLSGTPITQGLEDLWSQIYLLDGGARLGINYYDYLAYYFDTVEIQTNNKTAKKSVHETTILKYSIKTQDMFGNPCDYENIIYNRISDIACSAESNAMEYLDQIGEKDDLQGLNFVFNPVFLTTEQMQIYNDMKKYLSADLPTENGLFEIIAKNSGSKFNKLVQIASGTLYVDELMQPLDEFDEDAASDPDLELTALNQEIKSQATYIDWGKRPFFWIHKAKLPKLLQLIKQAKSPVLVGYNYICDKEIILKYLTEHGIKVEAFNSKKPWETFGAWNRGEIPVLLTHPKSVGHGLNLQYGGHTLIWYTLPTSLESYLQLNKRLYRPGQTNPVTIYHIYTQSTIDQKLSENLGRKENHLQSLLSATNRKF